MTPIVLKLFVARRSENANAPGVPSRQIEISHVKAPNTATPGPNDTFFEVPAAGGVGLQLMGLTESLHDALIGGKKLKVTIEEDV